MHLRTDWALTQVETRLYATYQVEVPDPNAHLSFENEFLLVPKTNQHCALYAVLTALEHILYEDGLGATASPRICVTSRHRRVLDIINDENGIFAKWQLRGWPQSMRIYRKLYARAVATLADVRAAPSREFVELIYVPMSGVNEERPGGREVITRDMFSRDGKGGKKKSMKAPKDREEMQRRADRARDADLRLGELTTIKTVGTRCRKPARADAEERHAADVPANADLGPSVARTRRRRKKQARAARDRARRAAEQTRAGSGIPMPSGVPPPVPTEEAGDGTAPFKVDPADLAQRFGIDPSQLPAVGSDGKIDITSEDREGIRQLVVMLRDAKRKRDAERAMEAERTAARLVAGAAGRLP